MFTNFTFGMGWVGRKFLILESVSDLGWDLAELNPIPHFLKFPFIIKKKYLILKGNIMSDLTFSEYQEKAKETALYPNVGNNPYYPTLGLTGEAGEISNKVKKIMRDKDGAIDEETRDDIKKELGDVLWYVAAVSSEFGLNMGDIATKNYEKLKKRLEEGKIKGNGDNR
jgi:NTP pyrophosphatase (non-canonical NTP hydrolase)